MQKTALGAGVLVASLLAGTSVPAEQAKQEQVVVKVDPTKETTITIKPFAAVLATKETAAAPAELAGKKVTSCTASVTYNNGHVDADCSIDF